MTALNAPQWGCSATREGGVRRLAPRTFRIFVDVTLPHGGIRKWLKKSRHFEGDYATPLLVLAAAVIWLLMNPQERATWTTARRRLGASRTLYWWRPPAR